MDQGLHGQFVDVLRAIVFLFFRGALEHEVRHVNELLDIERLANLFRLSQIMERAEQFLSTKGQFVTIAGLQSVVSQFEKHFGLVLHELLVLGQLADREKVSDQTLIQFNLLLVREGEVDRESVKQGVNVAQLVAFRDLWDVHKVVQAEERIDIDAWLQVSRQLQRLLHEMDCICLLQYLMCIVHLVDRCDHL